MDKTILCISLLNGQLKATAMRRGAVSGTWERPANVDDFVDFASVLREAVARTGPETDSVALVLAHPRLTQQLIETPPITGWKLRWFLERRVKQLKTFNTDTAWSYQQTPPTKNARAVLLHLF